MTAAQQSETPLIERLDALNKQRTPGQLSFEPCTGRKGVPCDEYWLAYNFDTSARPPLYHYVAEFTGEKREANAAFVCALVSAYPEIRDLLAAQSARLEAVERENGQLKGIVRERDRDAEWLTLQHFVPVVPEAMPEYFDKPHVLPTLADKHPVLLIRQLANYTLDLRARLAKAEAEKEFQATNHLKAQDALLRQGREFADVERDYQVLRNLFDLNPSAAYSRAEKAEAALAEAQKDARRFAWLAPRWSFIDFDFGPEEDASFHRPVIGFDVPTDARWSFSFDPAERQQRLSDSIDSIIDAGIAQGGGDAK